MKVGQLNAMALQGVQLPTMSCRRHVVILCDLLGVLVKHVQ